MMDADESGQLMDQGFASASDGWLSAPAGASDDSAQPLASSEADYTERESSLLVCRQTCS